MRILLALMMFASIANAKDFKNDYLIKVSNAKSANQILVNLFNKDEGTIEPTKMNNWYRVQTDSEQKISLLQKSRFIVHIQPNYIMKPFRNEERADINNLDPLFDRQWGMKDIGAPEIWKNIPLRTDIVVAVIDTGVDYLHEDLVVNVWQNPGEMGLDENGNDKATNGIDDDGNGYVDDVVGWDFVNNTNDPMDEVSTVWEMITGGGNPGHGTHCAGNVAARGFNNKGITGVHPFAKIMALRFIGKNGQGTTADAIEAIRYAVDNGAKILSNSWGSEGEDEAEGDNLALKDAIRYAEAHDVLFIAAAGNGHQGVGYDNDTDPKPGYPASYDMENIISVAALDINNNLGSFSNWGKRTVDIGAPGVKVFSTVPGNKYDDVVLEFFGQTVYWDGTSMACPHVSGAAALYWSLHPEKNSQEVKEAILRSAKPLPHLRNKLLSGGKLNVTNLLNE